MNIFDIPPPKEGEIFDILYKQKEIEITHIVSSSKLPDKLYDQDRDEFVLLLEGEAALEIEGDRKRLKKGDYLFIKARTKHRILQCADGTRWLAVYMKNSM